MARYRKRLVVIEAWRNDDETAPPAWVDEAVGGRTRPGGSLYIQTLEGLMEARLGDWLIQGVKGEVYPCKDEIFRATYESVEDGG